MAPPTPHPPFFCTECDYSSIKSGNMRRHFHKYHPEANQAPLEKHILQVRYPTVDFDEAVQRYIDRKETVWTMMHKGYRLTRYLRLLGVLRSVYEDIPIHATIKYGSASPFDNPKFVQTMLERYGTIKPSNSPELLEKSLRTSLENKGLGDLFEPIKTLRYVKKVLKEQAEGTKKSEET